MTLPDIIHAAAKRFDERPRYRASIEAQRELGTERAMNNELYEHIRSYVVHMVKARPWRLCELQAHAFWDGRRAFDPKHVAEVCDELVDDDVIRLRDDGFYESWL